MKKQHKKKLKRNDKIMAIENKPDLILNTIPDGMDIVDKNLNILWMNDKFLKVFGKKALGKKCYELYKDNKKQCENCPLKKPTRQAETQTIIVAGVCGGKIFEISHTGMLFGGKKAILETFRDITERKKMEEELQISRASFHNIVEKSIDGIIVVDSEGIIRFVNSSAEILFGREKEALLGELFGFPLTADKVTEIDIIRRSGERGVGEMNSVKTEWEGKSAYLIMILDVTERKKAEDLMKKQIEELKLLEQKKTEFVSIASHEIKTPTTAIQGFTELLMNKDVVNDVKTRDAYLRYIVDNTHRLKQLIDSILDLSRIDLGTFEIEYKKTPVTKIIDSLRKEMDIIIKKKGIKPIYKIEKNLPMINTDSNKLNQVLANLINNAIHYTNKGGKITVEAKRDKEFILFKVTDTGCGIAKDYLKRIFDKFYQIDSSQSRQFGGAGLGLSLCKGIVENMGGKIWASSTIGVGSTFQFTIPIEPKRGNKK